MQTIESKPPLTWLGRRAFLAHAVLASAFAVSGPSVALAAHGRNSASETGLHPAPAMRLCLKSPAPENRLLQEGFPLGNGTLGCLLGGEPSRQCLYLADASMWTGNRNAILGDDGQFPYQLRNFGTFTMLAQLYVELPGHDMRYIDGYERILDLDRGLVETRYRLNGQMFRQTVFASHPDQGIIIQLFGEKGTLHSGVIRLRSVHDDAVRATGMAAETQGSLWNGLRYGAAVKIGNEGGSVHIDGEAIRFDNVSSLTICLAGGTDYAADDTHDFRDKTIDPATVSRQRAGAAIMKGFEALRIAHEADYAALFGAMSVDFGASTPAQRALSIGDRLAMQAKPEAVPDPELDAFYLQFGRYLTIAGSRGKLPTNLQGLWLSDNEPPWRADYHTDINIQMNYWLPDRAGLPRCFDALAEYCLAQYSSWERLTRELYNDPRNKFRNSSGKVAGWTVAMSLNIHGGMGWWWQPASNAWLCGNLWQHYEYTQDRIYLDKIYPLMKGACAFWEARLIKITVPDATGGPDRHVLVDDHDWSPEQPPNDVLGVTYAQELVWELFENYRKAAALLGRDKEYAAIITELQNHLYLPAISPKTGLLEEWMSPDDLGNKTHRHLSPLVGLFPGDRIRADDSPPELVGATRRLLAWREMHSTGWGNAWRACCWARLKEGNLAYQLLRSNMAPYVGRSGGTAPNLFNTDVLPPQSGAYENDKSTQSLDDVAPDQGTNIFQIDANFGMAAAMIEMLVYSRPGRIEILPALPTAWAQAGTVTGIGARGGFVVDLAWRAGKPIHIMLRSIGGHSTDVVIDGKVRHLMLAPGEQVRLL